jgi:glutamate synthase domain-containing protein 2
MLSKISFGKRSNRHSECVPQAIRIVILSRADGEGSLIARECTSRLRAPSVRAGLALSARFGMTRQRLAQSATLVD